MTTATGSAATITISTTISTTPSTTPSTTRLNGSATSLAPRPTLCSSLVGVAARVIAGVTGALLGVAIGLVSAGFDTTRLLLAVGAVALGLGCVLAFVTGRAAVTATSTTSTFATDRSPDRR